MRSNYISIDGRKVHYFEAGSGSPVMLLHGWLTSSKAFRLLVSDLKKHFRLIAPDFPGFGASEELSGKHTLENYAGFLEKFVKKLGLKEISLVGVCMGGTIGLKYAVKNRKAIKKIIVFSPYYYSSQIYLGINNKLVKFADTMPFLRNLRKRYLKTKRVQNYVKEKMKEDSNPKFWDRIEPVINELFVDFDKMSARAAGEIGSDFDRMDLRSELRLLQIPVLVLYGDCEKGDFSQFEMEKLARIFPLGELKEIKGSHYTMLERPKEFSNIVFRFLADIHGSANKRSLISLCSNKRSLISLCEN